MVISEEEGMPFYWHLSGNNAHELAGDFTRHSEQHCGGRIDASAEQGAGGDGEYTGMCVFVKGSAGVPSRRLHLRPGDSIGIMKDGRLVVAYGPAVEESS